MSVSRHTPFAFCDVGAALMFHQSIAGVKQPAKFQPIVGTCCPVPPGSLLDEHVFASERCPPDSVVTGGQLAIDGAVLPGERPFSFELRCTKINLKEFRLQKAEPWRLEYGQADSVLSSIGLSPKPRVINRGRIPEHLRWGFGRIAKTKWFSSGCFGIPWGSALTAMSSKACEDFEFHKIVPLRQPDHPPKQCVLLALSDPSARCAVLD